MIVSRQGFREVIGQLQKISQLSFDVETTGLRPHHGDQLFSLIIGGGNQVFYFNFQAYPGLDVEAVLLPGYLSELQALFGDPTKTWVAHNAKFDLAFLAREGIEVLGTIHCTQAIERVVFNDHPPGGYDLDSSAARISFHKDDKVSKYIDEHELWEWSEEKPGAREKRKHFERVPFDLIVPYGERDAAITLRLAEHQEKALQAIANETDSRLPSVQTIADNERRLIRTVFKMEQRGILIDRPYCVRGAQYELDRASKACQTFKEITGREFKASGKLFQDVFRDLESQWIKTDKGNPSFDSTVLQGWDHPAAKAILAYRDAKSKSDFYRGFLYHADRNDFIHPNFNQAGTATGRFSSSNPNFQNLTAEEGQEDEEFLIRRAIIPRPGFIFIMPDYDQMEYRMMFDYACIGWGWETELVKQIKSGKDPHQATADLVTMMGRMQLNRKRAKNGNFAILYGSGVDTLAKTIGSGREEAIALKEALRQAAPEVDQFIRNVSQAARTRGYIRNWAGRRSHLTDANRAYTMPNYLIQGGCADVVKIAMNKIDNYLLNKKSQLVMTIHDELVIEVHEREIIEVPERTRFIMENVYPAKYLPLTCGMEWSDKSLGDKRKGLPNSP